MRGVFAHSPPDCPDVTKTNKGFDEFQSAAAPNPAIALWLQSRPPTGRVADIGALSRQVLAVMATQKEIAQFFRLALRLRLIDTATVERWVDSVIEAEQVARFPFTELASAVPYPFDHRG